MELFLEHKEKEKLRKNAYKKRMTMSDYVRKLIILDNKLNDLKDSNYKSNVCLNDIKNISDTLGRNHERN